MFILVTKTKLDEAITKLWAKIKQVFATKQYVDDALENIDLDQDHEVEDSTDIGKLIVTIGDDQYAVPREKIEKPAAPIITTGEDFYNSKSITITAVEGATIRYAMTTDGNTPVTPTASTGTAYSAAFNIGNTDAYQTTYKIVAVAIKNGKVSDPSTVQTFKCTRRVAAPTISIGGSKYDSSRTVTLTQAAADSIKYRLGDSGSFSTYDSSNKPTITTSGQKVYAYSVKANWANSATVNSNASDSTLNTKYTHAGLLSAENASGVNISSLTIEKKAASPAGDYTFTTGNAAKYIWFVVPDTQSINGVANGAVPQGFTLKTTTGGYKYYRMDGQMGANQTITLTVS